MVARSDFKVVHFSSVHSFLEGRILDKECASLAAAGYRVAYIAPGAPNEIRHGVQLRENNLPAIGRRHVRWMKTVPAMSRLVAQEQADLYHTHDPELLPVLLWLKRNQGAKIVYDAHEILPVKLQLNKLLGPKFIRPYLAPKIARLEHLASSYCDGVVAATEGIASYFPQDHTITVRNFARIEEIAAAQPVQKNTNKFVLIYAGSLAESRGIRETIKAVEALQGQVEFWLIGKWQSEVLRKACEAEAGWAHTRYFGWMEPSEVYSHLKAADAGVHLVHPIPAHSGGLPIKSFEYMAAGIPFIITDDPAKRETFKDLALFANPFDTNDVAAKLNQLVDNQDLQTKLAEQGKQAVRESFSWEGEAEKLVALYDHLLNVDVPAK